MSDATTDFGGRRIYHRALFGREDVLAQLDGWLLAEGDGGWALLVGGPGSGKSALLTHFLDRLEARGLTAPHYFSLRGVAPDEGRKQAERSLVDQIEALYPQLRGPKDEHERGLAAVLEQLSNRVLAPRDERLILVLDDLDALCSLDATLGPLPAVLPPGVWVLASARLNDPLLTSLPTAALSRLIDLSHPQWAASNEEACRAFWAHHAQDLGLSEAYVAEAVRRAEGNMLHAVMLLGWLRSLHPDDLAVMPPAQIPRGLDGFVYAAQGVIHQLGAGDPAAGLESMRDRLQLKQLAAWALRDDLAWAHVPQAELDPAEHEILQRAVREESPQWRRDPRTMPARVAQRLRESGWSSEQLSRVLSGGPGAVAEAEVARDDVFVGHSSPVKACCLTPEGRYLVSGSDDRTIRVWDLRSGAVVRILSGHASPVEDCAVSADGRRILSASADHTLKLWDTVRGREILTLSGHLAPVWACAILPDGRRALSASADHTLKIWDLQSGRELFTLRGHLGPVWACAVAADGQRAVSASADHTLKIWDLQSGQELLTLSGHLGPVLSCAIRGRLLLSGSADHTVKLWTLEGDEIATVTGHAAPVMACAATPDGARMVAGSNDGTLKIWDLETLRLITTLAGHRGPVSACTITPDGQRVISASDDGTLRSWDMAGSSELICSVTLDGERVISSWDDNALKLWQLRSGEALATLTGHTAPVQDCVVVPDGRYAVSRAQDNEIRIWDLSARRCVDTAKGVGDILFFSANRDRDASSKVWKLYSTANWTDENAQGVNFPRSFGPYTLLRPLARGGMGELFLARSSDVKTSDHLCVIKKLLEVVPGARREEHHARLLDEARLLMRLRHPNLVEVFDAGVIDGQVYLAMEVIAGQDLHAVLSYCAERQVRVPLGTALYLISEVARGLAFAHAYGGLHLVHRDIAPPNILCSFAGDVKLVDFGYASSLIQSEDTAPGVAYGRLGYMSPEQLVGAPVDRRTDLYALGVVLWEMLTGRRLLDHTQETEEVLRRVRSEPPVPPSRHAPDLPASLDALVLRALAPEAEDRFATAEELGQAVRQELERHAPAVDRSCVVQLLAGLRGRVEPDRGPDRGTL